MNSSDINFHFCMSGFNISIDNVFFCTPFNDPFQPLIPVNFVVDNAGNKTIDNEGNYWVA